MTDCPICNRIVMDDDLYCEYHQVAFRKLEEGWEGWKRALDLDWKNYLLQVYEVEGLGRWIQEVIDYIRSQESI